MTRLVSGGRRSLLILAAVLAISLSAVAVWAATGDLTPEGCIEDNDAGPDDCTVSLAADGLEQVREVVVSPDGKASMQSGSDEAVVPLRRNTANGNLAYIAACISDPTSVEACGNTAGLDGASSIAISPDGTSVYVGSEVDDAVVHLGRMRTRAPS